MNQWLASKRFVKTFGGVLILSVVFFANAALSSQIPAPDPIAIAKQATHVFVGRVVSTKPNSPLAHCSHRNELVAVVVEESLRGEGPNDIQLPVCQGLKGFHRTLVVDGVYLFFLKKNGDQYLRVYPAGSVIELG